MKRILVLSGALMALAGVPAAQAAIVTYNVTTTFYEPDTQPRDSIFIGSFAFDSDTKTVAGLHGILSESMTGDPIAYPNDNMTWLTLNYHLSSIPVTLDGADGLLVTTFLNNNTNTLYTGLGGNGWTPGTAQGLYYGFPGANPGNAYAMIFVNTTDPTTPLTPGQINKLAYADCAPGGMMGAVCMTGTTVAGWGELGTMSGYPVSQSITVVPLPGALGLLLSGLASLGVARVRRQGA
ncbi:MAG: PEP-CTERM sorting domain-containing protein [Gammaproteobacteria bacterium]